MAKNFLDKNGLILLWEKIKDRDSLVQQASANDATEKVNTAKQTLQEAINLVYGDVVTLKGYFTNGTANKATSDKNGNDITTTYVPMNAVGNAGGVCPLDQDGIVPATYLPSYVDDIIEGYYKNEKFYKEASYTNQITPSSGIIYVDLSTNKTYRWSGSTYVEISASLALGTTSGTAYDGASGAKNRNDIEAIKSNNPISVIGIDNGDLKVEYLNGDRETIVEDFLTKGYVDEIVAGISSDLEHKLDEQQVSDLITASQKAITTAEIEEVCV